MAYCTQQDIELRIGTAQLKQLTNDTWSATPPTLSVAEKAAGSLSGTFKYVVTALNDKGETVKSNEVSFTSGAVNKTATLSWTAVSTATSYKIYKSATTGIYTTPCLLLHTVLLTYDDTGSVTDLLVGSPPSDASIPNAAIVVAMIDKADREIDAKAGQVYLVPFVAGVNCTSISSIIKQISIDCAVYNCFLRRFSEMEVPKQWIELYKKAIASLDDVSNMLVFLDGAPTIASGEADFENGNSTRIDFSNSNNLESYY
jgi:hypothetical protein